MVIKLISTEIQDFFYKKYLKKRTFVIIKKIFIGPKKKKNILIFSDVYMNYRQDLTIKTTFYANSWEICPIFHMLLR